jgi:hypothetical protein
MHGIYSLYGFSIIAFIRSELIGAERIVEMVIKSRACYARRGLRWPPLISKTSARSGDGSEAEYITC